MQFKKETILSKVLTENNHILLKAREEHIYNKILETVHLNASANLSNPVPINTWPCVWSNPNILVHMSGCWGLSDTLVYSLLIIYHNESATKKTVTIVEKCRADSCEPPAGIPRCQDQSFEQPVITTSTRKGFIWSVGWITFGFKYCPCI